jgi:hypothetical protein
MLDDLRGIVSHLSPGEGEVRMIRKVAAAVMLVAASTGCAATANPAPTESTSKTAPAVTQKPTSSPAPSAWTMPNEIGKGLQRAQDDIQALTGDAIFFTYSTDALGLNRHQILDSNWLVCSETPNAGTTITASTRITFAAVKLTEKCP